MNTNGSMPHDTTAARKHVVVSKASSRKELARIVVEDLVPMIQHLQHDDLVTQSVCKDILQRLAAIEKKLDITPEAV